MSTTSPLYEGEGIKELIPQRHPIMMVDTFYDATEMECNTGLTILKDNIFCENGSLLEPGIIEHIAQSASAHAGYKEKLKNSPNPPVGYIGEVTQKQIERDSSYAMGDYIGVNGLERRYEKEFSNPYYCAIRRCL